MVIANIKKILDDDSKSSTAPKISFLGNRKQRTVTYEGKQLFVMLCNYVGYI